MPVQPPPDGPFLVHACPSLPDAAHVYNLLCAAGIEAELRNACLVGAMGEIPMAETWPQVWIRQARDRDRARECLRLAQRPTVAPSWTCKGCDEWLEGQFTACWRCGAVRDVGL